MGDISIKGRSPLLNKTLLDKTLKNFRIKSGKNPVMGTAEIMRSMPTLEVEYDRR